MGKSSTEEPGVITEDESRQRDAEIDVSRTRTDAGSDVPAAGQPLTARIEALLLSTDRPMTDAKIGELLSIGLEDGGTKAIREAIDELNAEYEETGRSFRIESVAGGRQILTLPIFGSVLHRLHQDRMQTRLTPAAMETLSIVAYRQPILRADVEAIRGVASGEVLRGLMERRLVKIVGRAEELGRPMLYGTTREFLRVFGLASLDDLPNAKELREVGRRIQREKAEEADAQEQSLSDPGGGPSPETVVESDASDSA